MRLFDCRKAKERESGIKAAARAIRTGKLVVIPTDTVYGIAVDAFSVPGVASLLKAKGRGRDMATPVLIGSRRALDGIAPNIPQSARELTEAFWPGPLTVIVPFVSTLSWDLGDTDGTVAVRMPLHPLALELLRETGPLAVSSANLTGVAPAPNAANAKEQLGNSVSVYLEAGESEDDVPSTIVDCVEDPPQVLREGALTTEQIRAIVPSTLGPVDHEKS
ncbi:L-threonylcarbamoyladenylate synthase [Natronoglycomyces albus]|uniref:L-threonylcarbamoyladenylate synthase n=1 Tax=Natronoglycomyces albus TaxID=2811108 RepID=UPI001BCF4B6C|nr:L-threonylcarbamoyladenylate synthase [Natronoglycomyces albus]